MSSYEHTYGPNGPDGESWAEFSKRTGLIDPTKYRIVQRVATCTCECSHGGWCGGCGHRGCSRR